MSGNQGQGAGNVGMSPLNKGLHFIVLQFLYEQGLHETAHRLERDTQLYFDLKYFEELILAGRWAEAEWYLRGYFVDVQGNTYGLKLLFEIYKQKFFEALYRHEKEGALDILHTEFRSILSPDEDIYKELNCLFSLPDFREHPRLKEWDNPQEARATLFANMRKIALKCPDLKDKVHFPTIPRSRLLSLVYQSFNWQHFLCERRLPNAAMATLLKDHNCSERMPPRPSMSARFLHRPAQNFTLLPSLSFNAPMSSAAGPSRLAINVSGRLAIDVTGASDVRESSRQANMHLDSRSSDSIAPAKRFRASELSTSESARSSNKALHKSHNLEKLPTSLAMELHLDSSVVSMDFNPIQQTLLLVGTSLGEISIWDLSSKERICQKCFGLDNPDFSVAIQHALDKEGSFFSVRRVLWSTDGCQFVVAYCKHLVQMYEFSGNRDLQCTFEIDAHKGGLNDIAFLQPIKKMFVVTSGDDGAIRVWIAVSGLLVHTFSVGHSAPVLSICPQSRGFNQYILSASSDGKIRSWRYDKDEPEHEFEGPTCSSVSFAATTDGSRLFSCGTIKDGTGSPFLVEWNEPHEGIIRRYSGLSTNTDGALQLDITKDHTLAIGDDSMVKFWNVDESEPLCSIDTGGGLPTFPRIRFNNSGSLLAVSANDNFIKILASKSGQEMLSPSHLPSTAETSSHMDDEGTSSCRAIVPFSGPETSVAIIDLECNAGTSTSGKGTYAPLSPIIELDEEPDEDDRAIKDYASHPNEINEPSQCLSLRLPDMLPEGKVHQLVYANEGESVMALSSNGTHKLWRWNKTCLNPSEKATVCEYPIQLLPSDGLMINDRGAIDIEAHSFALSKENKFLISTSGGLVSLFNVTNSEKLGSYLRPPPVATVFAFHPQNNNRVAIGMDDCTILIFEPQRKKVCCILSGHNKRITGLCFSTKLDVLISSGLDPQLCIWKMDTWEKLNSICMELNQEMGGSLAHISVEFHPDGVQLLVVHATQLTVYNAGEIEQLHQWSPNDMMISSAMYSCDGEMVYSCMTNQTIIVFTKSLQMRFRINPGAYLSFERLNAYPVVVAAHPFQPTQFAIGMTDGGVQIFEPLPSDGQWCRSSPLLIDTSKALLENVASEQGLSR